MCRSSSGRAVVPSSPSWSCEDVRCGTPETGVVDVVHGRANNHSQQRCTRLRTSRVVGVFAPLTVPRREDPEFRVNSDSHTQSPCPVVGRALPSPHRFLFAMHIHQLIVGSLRIAPLIIFLALCIALVTNALPVFARDSTHLRMTLPGNKCTAQHRPSWLPSEKWAWTQICEGRKANFNAHFAENLDPRSNSKPQRWKNRTLSRYFLRTIMLFEPYKNAIPHRGVFIVGGYFPDGLDLNDAPTERRLVLERSLFPLPVALDRFSTSSYVHFSESKFLQPLIMVSASITDDLLLRNNIFLGPVDIRGVSVGGQLSLMSSEFHGPVVIESARIAGSVVLDAARFCCEVLLTAASAGIQLSTYGAIFEGLLSMNSIEISDSLLIGTDSKFGRVDLSGADIGNQLSAAGAVFSEELDMNSITVGGDIFMRKGTRFSEVDLVGARINGTLSVVDSIFEGDLSMDSAFVGDNLFLERAEFRGPVDLQFVHVGSNLDLRATSLTSVDLTGARITGDFRLGSSNVKEIVVEFWKRRLWKHCGTRNYTAQYHCRRPSRYREYLAR